MNIWTEDPAGFFNAQELGQGNGPSNPALWAAFPSLQWDSWGDILMSADLGFSPGFPDVFKAGGGNEVIEHDDIAWFDSDPFTPEGVLDGRIRIAQLTWTWDAGPQPDYNVYFKVSVMYGDHTQERWVEFEGGGFHVFPSPGALTLLGLAGLIGRRRR
jgi:hypothetical protein